MRSLVRAPELGGGVEAMMTGWPERRVQKHLLRL